MEPLQYEARGYLKEPFRLFHLADGQRERIEYHYHTFHKIIILLAGKAGYAIEGERYDLTPGDFVLVGRGSIHRPEVEEDAFYERMILYISPAYLRRWGRRTAIWRPASGRRRRTSATCTATRGAAGCVRCSSCWPVPPVRAATARRCWSGRSFWS